MHDDMHLKGKNVVITGASSGIGRKCAVQCSRLGASVLLFGRNVEGLEETLSLMEGDRHQFFAQDHTQLRDLEEAVREFAEEVGKISGFIHSAGICKMLAFGMHSSELYQEHFVVNTVYGFEAARILAKKKYVSEAGASFVLISSIVDKFGMRGLVAYAASKGALVSGAKSMAMELASRGIRVNTVSPGMVIDTPMTDQLAELLSEDWRQGNAAECPLGPVSANDVASACTFLLSEFSGKITGINLVVDGGISLK